MTQKKRQMLNLQNLITIFSAYSIYHYSRASVWKWVYWIGGISSIVLSGTNTIIDTIYDECEHGSLVRNYNIVLGTIITIGLGIITFLNAHDNRRNNEDAGDKYRQLEMDLYNTLFMQNKKWTKLDLQNILEIYTLKFNGYIENFYEPPSSQIEGIIKNLKKEIV